MTLQIRNVVRITFLSIALVAVTACGGGGSTPPPPPPAMYSIGGMVSGLDAGQSVVLQLNGGNDLAVDSNAAFTFAFKIASGGAYAVTVAGGPAGKTCTVNGGAGTASVNVTGVVVACVPTFSIGGSVSGLVGHDLTVYLQVYAGSYVHSFVTVEKLAISKNGDFVFAGAAGAGSHYQVVIGLQPSLPTQRCVVSNAHFTIAAANVTNVEIVCDEFSYVANAVDNTITALSIDATTGAIASAGSPVPAGTSPVAMADTSDKKYVYVANSHSNDVSAFAVDSGSGALATVPGSPIVAGTNPRALAVFGTTYLYVANAGSDTVSAYQIDQNTGLPAPLSPASYTTGTGPGPTAIQPNGLFLYTANAGGSSNISAFQIYDATGGLTPIAGSPFPSGSSVSSLAFGASGAFLYAADANGGAAAIYGYSLDSSGALISLGGFPYPLPSCTFIVADQTGAYLYATTGTDLLGYSIDATTGALTLLSGFPIAVGANVRSVSIDPTNQFLYVANGSAGTVTSYTLNAATGALTLMPGSPFAVGTSADYITTF